MRSVRSAVRVGVGLGVIGAGSVRQQATWKESGGGGNGVDGGIFCGGWGWGGAG